MSNFHVFTWPFRTKLSLPDTQEGSSLSVLVLLDKIRQFF